MTKKQFLAKVNKQGNFLVNDYYEHVNSTCSTEYKSQFAIVYDLNGKDDERWIVAYNYGILNNDVNTTIPYTLEEACKQIAYMMMLNVKTDGKL